MTAYADTGFVASLFLVERTSEMADKTIGAVRSPLPLIPLAQLELRNTFNLAIVRKRITRTERDALWHRFEAQVRTGAFQPVHVSVADLYAQARELSDRHTPVHATRTLDLLHVAAALLLESSTFLSFDERQRRVASAEGLLVKP
jgi:hypothetical protein